MANRREIFTPERVLLTELGHAVRPSEVAAKASPIYVIFVRKDGWTLGASKALEQVAYRMWKEEWVERWHQYSDLSGAWWERMPSVDCPTVMDELTVAKLHNACRDAIKALDIYAPITAARDTLAAIRDLCHDSIGASHQGCAADVVILERGEDIAVPVPLQPCPDCGTTFQAGCATCETIADLMSDGEPLNAHERCTYDERDIKQGRMSYRRCVRDAGHVGPHEYGSWVLV